MISVLTRGEDVQVPGPVYFAAKSDQLIGGLSLRFGSWISLGQQSTCILRARELAKPPSSLKLSSGNNGSK